MTRLRCSRYEGAWLEGANGLEGKLLGAPARYAPDRAFDTLHVALEFDVNFASQAVSGLCVTTFRPYLPLKCIELDAAGMRVLEAAGPSGRLPFSHRGERLRVSLPRTLKAGEESWVRLRYRIVKPEAGLHFVRPGPGNRARYPQLWSQGQPEYARYWFPCHDAPHEKATSEVKARVPAGFTAVSNGVLAATEKKGKVWTYHWRMEEPHALYLISLAVGRFAELSQEAGGVPLRYYCEEGLEADARRGFAKTPAAMKVFSESFGPYPYARYAQTAVAEFPLGGMENTTATTQTDACLLPAEAAQDNDLDLLVAHELAHQWFGNLVTCRDWSHAWLNEGFATYAEILFLEATKGRDEADYELGANAAVYFDEDEKRYRRPIVCNSFKHPSLIFDRHLYEKGSWVLHMLRHELGEDAWRETLKEYLRRHRGRSVETGDFVAAIEESVGRNMRWFFDQWVHRPGYPEFRVDYEWLPKERRARLKVLQTQQGAPFRARLDFRFRGPKGRWVKDRPFLVERKEQTLTLRLPQEPANVELDPDGRLLKKADFRKPAAFWEEQLHSASRALGRIEAARRVARWGDPGALRALRAAFARERFWGAKAELARAMGECGGEGAFEALRGVLREPHPKVRRAVVAALGRLRRRQAAPALGRLTRSDSSLHVRAEAARALGALQRGEDMPLWRSLLARESYWDILAGGAIGALAASRSKEALPLLLKATRPPFKHPARGTALRALSGFLRAHPSVLEGILPALDDPDERAALAAIQALGAGEDLRALPHLEKALKRQVSSRLKAHIEEAIARLNKGREAGK